MQDIYISYTYIILGKDNYKSIKKKYRESLGDVHAWRERERERGRERERESKREKERV